MASDGNSTAVKVKQEPGVLKIKTEPGLRPQIKTERLSSFKLPRDLTLGGPGPGRTSRGGAAKKVYTPNLNAVRQKNTDVKTSRDTQQKKTVRTDRARNDRGGRGGGNNYIQTMGVFSEGTAKSTVKRHAESRYSSVESRPIRRSAASKKDANQSLDASTALRNILDSSDEDDIAMDEDATMPVMLQAAQTDRNVFSIAKDVKVKVEDDPDEISSNAPTVSTTVPFSTKVKVDPDGVKAPETLEEIFGAKSSQLFLLQLPDTLPGRTEERDPATEETRTDEKEAEIPTSSLNSLREQDEGLVGKIVRYKSGKTKLVLGNSQFDLDVGIDTDFLQQLVSIDANPERRSGNMYNLGKVHTKLTATPDWEHMFRNMI